MTVQMSFDEASKIMTETPNSQLVLLPKRLHIKLSPKYIGSVKTGVSELLKSQLSFLNKELDGVPIAFKNIKGIQRLGRVIADQACLHFDIEAEFILFKPTIGSILKGVINKVGKKHVGCLVHSCFNAWFLRSDIVAPPGADLLSKEVEFTVLEIFSNNRVVSLKGKFLRLVSELDPSKGIGSDAQDSVSGEVGDLSSSPIIPIMTSTQIETPGTSSKKLKKHKKKSKHGDDLSGQPCQFDTRLSDSGLLSPAPVNGEVDSVEGLSNSSKHKKKKKKKNRIETDNEVRVKEESEKTLCAEEVDRKPSKRKLELLEAESGNSSADFVSPKKKVKKEKKSLDISASDNDATKNHKKSKKKKNKLKDN